MTNWYIRRSRRRFWRAAEDVDGQQDKAAAYATLYEALVTFAKVMAPILPFVTESLYQNLVVQPATEEVIIDSLGTLVPNDAISRRRRRHNENAEAIGGMRSPHRSIEKVPG